MKPYNTTNKTTIIIISQYKVDENHSKEMKICMMVLLLSQLDNLLYTILSLFALQSKYIYNQIIIIQFEVVFDLLLILWSYDYYNHNFLVK